VNRYSDTGHTDRVTSEMSIREMSCSQRRRGIRGWPDPARPGNQTARPSPICVKKPARAEL